MTSPNASSKVQTKLSGGLIDIPIVHALYQLYKALHELLLKFPKSQRYSLGSVMQTELLDLMEAVVTAANTAKPETKKERLSVASTKLDLLRLMVRLSKDCKCVDNKTYLALESQLHEIGRMLGGWLKSL